MVTRRINIDTIDKVKALVGEATAASFDVNITTERFTVNAKSILGIFSLNRNAPVTLEIHADENSREVQSFLSRIGEYIV